MIRSLALSLLFAQTNQQKYDELIRSARQTEVIGYILGGLGILIVVAAIPYGIYLDRRKKAAKKAEREKRGRRGDDARTD